MIFFFFQQAWQRQAVWTKWQTIDRKTVYCHRGLLQLQIKWGHYNSKQGDTQSINFHHWWTASYYVKVQWKGVIMDNMQYYTYWFFFFPLFSFCISVNCIIYTCFVNTTSCLYTVYNLYSKITVMHGSTDQRMSCFFLFFLSPINVDLPSSFSELFGFSTAVVLLIEQRPSIAFKFSYLSEEELWSMNSSTSKEPQKIFS